MMVLPENRHGCLCIRMREKGVQMRKIRRLLFGEAVFTEEYAAYLTLLTQVVIRKYHGRKIGHLWTKIIYKSFSVLIALSFLGTLRYGMSRTTPAETKVQEVSTEIYGDRGWNENRRMLSMWQGGCLYYSGQSGEKGSVAGSC